MGRKRINCPIENCTRKVKSVGQRGGRPFYGTLCSVHRRKRKEAKKQANGIL